MIICFGLALCMITISSCKKEYDCTCIVTFSDGSTNEYQTNIRSSKKNKQADCEATTAESSFGKTCTVK